MHQIVRSSLRLIPDAVSCAFVRPVVVDDLVLKATTWPSTPEQGSPPASAAAGTAPSPEGAAAMATRMRSHRSRAPKRPRREATVERRWGLSRVSAYSASLRSNITEPGLIMKVNTAVTAFGPNRFVQLCSRPHHGRRGGRRLSFWYGKRLRWILNRHSHVSERLGARSQWVGPM